MMRSRPFLIGAAVTIVVFLVIYGSILVATGGMPYVMDGNESFSSLWHARNLIELGAAKSMGLADEAFSPHPDAHPYVHTHQGNFPRVFATLIYVLGAQTIESQIIVTTLTAGLVSVLLAYLFVARIANPLLATLAALVLITDYLMIGQWLLVTYRVWHLFFVFSSLLCVHAIGSIDRRVSLPLGVLNFACLFYFELIFVAFVALASALYAAYLYAKAPRTLLVVWAVQAVGALLGLGMLVGQLVLYMGWEAFVHDAQLTFMARNVFRDEQALIAHIKDFYESNRIIFWYNLEDGSRFRSPQHFLASLTYYEFQIHTPFFTYVSFVVALGLFAAALVPFKPFGSRPSSTLVLVRDAVSVYPVSPVLGLAAVHIVHRLIRGESITFLVGMLFLIGALIVSWIIYCSRLFAAARSPVDSGGIQERLRKGSSLTALLILVVILLSVVAHVSVLPMLLDRYSVYYAAFLAVYCALFVHSLLRMRRAPSRADTPRPGASATNVRDAWMIVAAWAALVLAVLVFKDGAAYLGKRPEFLKAGFVAGTGDWIASAAIATALCVGLIYAWPRSAAVRRMQRTRWRGRSGAIAGTLLLFGSALALALAWLVFHSGYAVLWEEVMATTLPSWLARTLPAAATVLAVALVLAGPRYVTGAAEGRMTRNVGMFLLTGFVAYAVVYVLSPGYIFSGYRFRIVPFTAFHNNVVMALALYVMLRAATFLLARARLTDGRPLRRSRAAVGSGPGRFSSAPSGSLVCGTALAIMALVSSAYWLSLQANYLRWFPPDHYAVLKELRKTPFRNASFAANVYAGPIAAFTDQWAYLDEVMAYGWVSENADKRTLEASDRYLWFADRSENAAYRRPEYYFCMIMQSFPALLAELRWRRGEGPPERGCDAQGLIRLALDGSGQHVEPRVRMVAIDEDGPKRTGYARWAIVKLDWPGKAEVERAAKR